MRGRLNTAALAAAVLASMGPTFGTRSSRTVMGGAGGGMSREERQALKAERLARAPRMLAKAEAKRQRKAARRAGQGFIQRRLEAARATP